MIYLFAADDFGDDIEHPILLYGLFWIDISLTYALHRNLFSLEVLITEFS